MNEHGVLTDWRWQGKTYVLKKIYLTAPLPITNKTPIVLGINPSLHADRPTTYPLGLIKVFRRVRKIAKRDY